MWLLKRSRCPDCGGTDGTCGDPDKAWYPQRLICFATMQRSAAEARYEEIHEAAPYHDGTFKSWAKERSKYHPFHFRDGVSITVAPEDLNPDDQFLTPDLFRGEDDDETPAESRP